MKIIFRAGLLLLVLSLLTPMAWADNAAIYAQLSSQETQVIGLSKNKLVLLDQDEASGINLNDNHDHVIIKESGTYFIMAAGQIGTRERQNEAGYVDLWLVKNGQAVANSNTRQATGPNFTTVLVSQSVIHLDAEDSIGFAFSATRPSLGLIASAANGNEPLIPSIIISIFKIK